MADRSLLDELDEAEAVVNAQERYFVLRTRKPPLEVSASEARLLGEERPSAVGLASLRLAPGAHVRFISYGDHHTAEGIVCGALVAVLMEGNEDA